MLDDVARFNRDRWEDLARAGVRFTRPWEDLDAARARALVDPDGMLPDLTGRDVLCLAGGGGQQSAAFGLLGARVTVVDFSRAQIESDRATAARYGLSVRLIEGDIRDLSVLADDAFDLVWNAHSINFVPDPRPVFDGVARVLRPGGLYRLQWTNPFVHGIWDAPWTAGGYPLRHRYVDGGEVPYDDPVWNVTRPDGSRERVRGPREWRHGLGTVVNGLVARLRDPAPGGGGGRRRRSRAGHRRAPRDDRAVLAHPLGASDRRLAPHFIVFGSQSTICGKIMMSTVVATSATMRMLVPL